MYYYEPDQSYYNNRDTYGIGRYEVKGGYYDNSAVYGGSVGDAIKYITPLAKKAGRKALKALGRYAMDEGTKLAQKAGTRAITAVRDKVVKKAKSSPIVADYASDYIKQLEAIKPAKVTKKVIKETKTKGRSVVKARIPKTADFFGLGMSDFTLLPPRVRKVGTKPRLAVMPKKKKSIGRIIFE